MSIVGFIVCLIIALSVIVFMMAWAATESVLDALGHTAVTVVILLVLWGLWVVLV